MFNDYNQFYNHLGYLIIDFLVANDIIPFNEKGINRSRTPIIFNLFNTNLRYKSNTITLSYSCHAYIFLFHYNKYMFVLWFCTLHVHGFGFCVLD
jgi:hypothetical protein